MRWVFAFTAATFAMLAVTAVSFELYFARR